MSKPGATRRLRRRLARLERARLDRPEPVVSLPSPVPTAPARKAGWFRRFFSVLKSAFRRARGEKMPMK